MPLRRILSLPLLASVVLLAGCFERDSILELNKDGSGTLTIHTTVGEALMKYAQNHAGVASREDWFNETALRRAAGNHGEGVRYVEHSVTETERGSRFTVVYAFDDVRAVSFRVDTEIPFLLTPPENQAGGVPAFRFGGNPEAGILEIIPPPVVERGATPHRVQVESARAREQREERFRQDRAQLVRHGNPFELRGDESREELARALVRGMRFELTVVPPAPIVAGNARHVRVEDGRHFVTLFAMDAEKALQGGDVSRLAQNMELHLVTWRELSRAKGTRAERDHNVRLRWLVE